MPGDSSSWKFWMFLGRQWVVNQMSGQRGTYLFPACPLPGPECPQLQSPASMHVFQQFPQDALLSPSCYILLGGKSSERAGVAKRGPSGTRPSPAEPLQWLSSSPSLRRQSRGGPAAFPQALACGAF